MNSIAINNQINFYEAHNQNILNYALKQLKKEYENKDKEIFHSKWRKENGYIPHGTRKRTLVTIFGKLTYERHRYLIWNKNRYHFIYLSDLALGIKKYQRISIHLQIKVLSLISRGKRYQDISDCFPKAKITTNTISNIINRTKVDSLEDIISKQIQPVKIDKYLYVNIDDTFLNLKENNKKEQYRIRVVLFHCGYDTEKSKKNKKSLKNSRIFVFLFKKTEQVNTKWFLKKIYRIANIFYSNIEESKVIISGDGAPWIRSCQKYWPKSIYILDRFHAIRKIRQVFNPNNKKLQSIYHSLKTLFVSGTYQEMIEILSRIHLQDPHKNSKLKQLKHYLFYNEKYQGISNQAHESNIGCNIESTISHHVKSLLGYGSKAFSKNIYLKILTLHIADTNGVDTINLFKKTFIEENSSNYDVTWQKNE